MVIPDDSLTTAHDGCVDSRFREKSMGDAIGAVLPLAVGIAISPIPIIAAILLLVSPKARTAGAGFALGWIVGILTVVVLFLVFGAVIPSPTVGGTRPVPGGIHLVAGIVLIGLSVRQFRSAARTRDHDRELPAWMRAIDRLGFWDALGLGVLLAAVNPKNLLLGAAAGIALGSSGVRVSEAAVAIAVYVLVAASTILVPIIGVLVAGDRAHQPLGTLRAWLERENTVIMGFVLLILGVVVLSKGIAYF